MLIEIISAFFVAFSFGVLFNIKGKYLFVAGVGGALGWFVYKISLDFCTSEAISLFIASIAFSIYSEQSARIFHTPTTLIRVCALIVLVPGYGIYNTMYYFLTNDYVIAMDFAANTLSNACALVLGVVLVSSIYKKE